MYADDTLCLLNYSVFVYLFKNEIMTSMKFILAVLQTTTLLGPNHSHLLLLNLFLFPFISLMSFL